MRCLVGCADGNLASDDGSRNLYKATAHMQRAVLDVCKYFILGIQKRIKEFKECHPVKILTLVTDGDFYRKFKEKENEATELYKVAKFSDSALGEKKEANAEVLQKYIDSVVAFYKLWDICEKNREKIAKAEREYDRIITKGKVVSIFVTVVATIAITLLLKGIF